MKLKNYFIVLFILFTSNSYSQIFANDSVTRVVNIKALNLITDYENAISFKTKANFENFKSLFNNSSTLIFNDIMPHNKLDERVNPSEYISILKKYYSSTSFIEVKVSPYEVGAVTHEGPDLLNVSVFAKKYVSSISLTGLYYIDTFNVRFDIIYDLAENRIVINDIASIERNGIYAQVFSRYRGLFYNYKLKSDTILVNDIQYALDTNGYTLLKDIYYRNEYLFVPLNKQVLFDTYKFKPNIPLFKNRLNLKKDKNIVKVNFWRWLVFADFQYTFIPSSTAPIKIDDDKYGINPVNTGTFSNYFMFNIIRRVSPKGFFALKFGFGADFFNYQLNLNSYINSYPSVDPDGDPYLRINKVYNIQERHNSIYLTAPLTIQKGFSFGKNSIYLQASYYLMSKYSSSYNMDAKATYSGYYDYLFNLTISENGVYDFGTYNFKLRALPTETNNFIKSYSLGIGYNRQLTRTIYFDFGLNYRTSSDYLFIENIKTLSESRNGINSLLNLNNKLRIDYVNLNFGLSIKI